GKRLLATRKQQHVLQALTWRLGRHLNAALGIGVVGKAQLAVAAAEQGALKLVKINVDRFEVLQKLLTRNLINLADGLCGNFDRSKEVLTLRLQKAVALLRLLQFFERHHVHWSEVFDSHFQLGKPLLGPLERFAAQGLLRSQFGNQSRRVHLQLFPALPGAMRQIGLGADQRNFGACTLFAQAFERRARSLNEWRDLAEAGAQSYGLLLQPGQLLASRFLLGLDLPQAHLRLLRFLYQALLVRCPGSVLLSEAFQLAMPFFTVCEEARLLRFRRTGAFSKRAGARLLVHQIPSSLIELRSQLAPEISQPGNL